MSCLPAPWRDARCVLEFGQSSESLANCGHLLVFAVAASPRLKFVQLFHTSTSTLLNSVTERTRNVREQALTKHTSADS